MCDYSTYQPKQYFLGSHIPATSAEPSSSFVNWTLSPNTSPPQIPAPIFHPGMQVPRMHSVQMSRATWVNAFAVATTSDLESRPLPSIHCLQGRAATSFCPLYLILCPFLRSMHSYTTDNALRLTSSISGFAAPNIMQGPPSGSRLTHVLDPDVNEDYQWSVHDLYLCLIC